MSSNAREALNRLVAALENHLDLAQNIDVVQPSLLEHAFFTCDDALFTEFDVELPFEILDDTEEDEDEESDDIEEDDLELLDADDDDSEESLMEFDEID